MVSFLLKFMTLIKFRTFFKRTEIKTVVSTYSLVHLHFNHHKSLFANFLSITGLDKTDK